MKRMTTCPKNDPYYRRQVSGGLNGAVEGYWLYKPDNTLCNCFGGETKYVTDEGLKSFYETVDTTQNVLNENGEFVPAEIKSFGEQQLFKVTFSNSFSVYATANHRWVVDRYSAYNGKKYKKRVIKTTLELNDADNIPYNYFNGNGVLDIDGIVHGIVFGDGHKNNNCSTYQVQLFGNKVELKKYLPEHIRSDYDLKEVPSIYESEEYLRGFVAGLLATDGTVTKDTFKVSSVNKEALKQIENICYKIGVHIGGIYEETRDVEVGGYEYKDHVIYYLTLKRKGVDELLLKESDKRKISEQYKDIKYTRIKSVEPTDRFEEVFCAVEPITHTITLENNILTGQCVGFANGRFNQIINDPDLKGISKAFKYQLVCNAENFNESAKRQGLKISKKPTLGGIMVWQKGNTLDSWDGAGHVEVVEKINDDGSIICSSSGYGSKGWAFRLLRRTNANGNWMQVSPYKYRGCIINPSIKDGETPTDQPLIIDGIGGGLTVIYLQRFLGKFEDGVISGQYANQAKYRRALTAVENGGGGSSTVSALQKWLGITADGYWGKDTSKALQKKLVAEGFDVGPDGCDSYFGTDSMKALQMFLNWKIWGINPPSPKPKQKKYKMIDVSSHQGKINWKKVKADGITGAIIRYADDDVIDTYFDANMKGAIAAGLHVGTYIYSRARNKAEAERDAVNLYNASKPYLDKIDMPMYIDLETKGLEKVADTVATAFLNKMASLGVKKRGVYANLHWWDNYLPKTRKMKDAAIWVAQFYSKCQYKPASDIGVWQYTSTGEVDGISSDWVDMDWCYKEYWK